MRKRTLLTVIGICLVTAAFLYAKSRTQHAFTFTNAPVAVAAGSSEAEVAPPQPAASADDWPQWRGPNRDAVSPATGLLTDWPEEGPPLVWTAKGPRSRHVQRHSGRRANLHPRQAP